LSRNPRAKKTRRPSTSSPEPPAPAPKPDPVLAYAKAVVSGTIVAGPHVRNSCRRHLQDLERGPARGLKWDLDQAVWVIGYFREVLRLNGGQFEGLPFELQPSQAFIVGSLFGWRRADGTRRFRRAYMEEGKGNGKSPLLAGVGLFCLTADDEARAEVYAAASKRDQAMVLFRDAVAMTDQSPELQRRLTASGNNPVWNLADLERGSFFRPISSDDKKSGPRPSCALCDEVHEHRDGNTIEMLERGFKWRRQPLLIMATNSGTDRNSVCYQEHLHAVRVAAGSMSASDQDSTYVGEVVHDEAFSYVCALDKDDDPLEDPSCWVKTNPLLGVTLKPDTLESAVRQAKAIPGKLNGVLRLHFCVWTDAEEAWMARSTLELVMFDFDPEVEHAGKEIDGAGIDLSASQDLTAEAFCIQTGTMKVERLNDDGVVVMHELPTYDAWVEVWTPKDSIAERALRDQQPYKEWAKDGWLHAEPGRNIRLDFVAARTAEIHATTPIKLLAYDRYSYSRFADDLDQCGVTIRQTAHPQGGTRRAPPTDEQLEDAKRRGEKPPPGLWMPGSVLELESMILERRIRIRRSPVMMSAMMSATTESDPYGNRWFSKRKAVNRIDPLVALAMAIGAATSVPSDGGRSMYEDRGLLVLG
jgi:phage terminase large subunit-like protein